jgi:hypothetical protein
MSDQNSPSQPPTEPAWVVRVGIRAAVWAPVAVIVVLAVIGEFGHPIAVLRAAAAGICVVATALAAMGLESGRKSYAATTLFVVAAFAVVTFFLQFTWVESWADRVVGPRSPDAQAVVDLSNLKVHQRDVAGRVLAGGQFRGTTFIEVELGGANLSGASLQRAVFVNGRLSGTQLRGADLSGADLRGAHLEGADLTGATLVNACLADAVLTGANLADADLSGADSTRTTKWPTRFIPPKPDIKSDTKACRP